MTTSSDPPRRSLAPREHGAYGQLGLPLVTALVAPLDLPSPAALLFAFAALAAFFAHEPLLVLLGQRGRRARDEHGRRAALRLAVLGLAAVTTTSLAVWLAPQAWRALMVPFAGALLLAPLIATRRERTTLGEILAAATLAAAALPVARATGASSEAALASWLAWACGYSAIVPAVRTVVATAKQQPLPPTGALVALAVVPLVPSLLWWRWEPVAAVPLLTVAVALQLWPPHPRQLRRIGWALVAASTATAAILVGLAQR